MLRIVDKSRFMLSAQNALQGMSVIVTRALEPTARYTRTIRDLDFCAGTWSFWI
jgi:hypothetical protein